MAPRDSGMRWKQFMMCLEQIQFVVGVHSPPMHDPGLEEFQRPVRVCECKGASVLPCQVEVEGSNPGHMLKISLLSVLFFFC